MEPLLELATQITSQLWFFHEHYPDEKNLAAIVAKDWRSDFAQEAANDYSRLQAMFDLTDTVGQTDWSKPDPLPHISLEEKALGVPAWNVVGLVREARKRRERRKKSASEIRRAAAQPALNKMQVRISVLQASGLADSIVLAGFRSADSAEAREGLIGDQVSPPQPAHVQAKTMSDSDVRTAPPRLLTREQLFDDVASRLFVQPPETLHELANQFVKGGTFLMQGEIDNRVKDIRKWFHLPLSNKTETESFADAWQNNLSDWQKTESLLDRTIFRNICRDLDVPVPFSVVLTDELDEIARSRIARLGGINQVPPKPAPQPPQMAAFKSCLFGLALSGGGIRSATFGLGLLQGMADRNMLPYIDILSTVSGGGYIGSWFISWIKRRGSVDSVQQSLRGAASDLRTGWVTRNSDPSSDHVRPVRLLREYARYLAPAAGFYSVDSWTIAATWIRNTALNLAVLIPLLAVLLLIPRVSVTALMHVRTWDWAHRLGSAGEIVALSIPLLAACIRIGYTDLSTFGPYRKSDDRGSTDAQIFLFVVPAIFLWAFLEVGVMWNSLWNTNDPHGSVIGFCVIVTLGLVIVRFATKEWRDRKMKAYLVIILAFCLCIALTALLTDCLHVFLEALMSNTARGIWIVADLGVSLLVLLIAAIVVAFLGFSGKELSDEQREWWGRLGACLGQATVGWLLICCICFFVPLWIAQLSLKVAALGISSWVAITTAGLKLAVSSQSNKNGKDTGQNWFSHAVMNLAPVVFAFGILCAVSFGLFWALPIAGKLLTGIHLLRPHLPDGRILTPSSIRVIASDYWSFLNPGLMTPVILMLVLTAVCGYMAWRVDINEFSMHHFYRNRLVRAYLGASRARAHRLPNAFTGFDVEDDIRLSRFQSADETQPRDMAMDCKAGYSGPFPILNTALNITKGEDLGLQQRKAESFIFTPLRSGYDFSRRQTAKRKIHLTEYAFRQTEQFGEPANHGCLLGTAMAISGAALSSNSGFRTSPALAFLLTVFGVRLGWWAGNPRKSKWSEPSPELGLLYLIHELTATTSTDEEFVLLSDGGHFENMGLYELIRRRCRFIIVSDAEEDRHFKLEGIGGAVRKCRDDFGVVIDLNLDALKPIGPAGSETSRLHYSVGSVIYPGEAQRGMVLYIKASVTGDEPLDVVEFRKNHPEFPHTSTVNQFFDESHFESYRALGHHIASEVFTHDMPSLPLREDANSCCALQDLFECMKKVWKTRLERVRNDNLTAASLPPQD